MIANIKKVIKHLNEMGVYDLDGQELFLKTWAESIIDECAGNFECTMEDEEEDGSVYSKGHPVLMRGSILQVKKQL